MLKIFCSHSGKDFQWIVPLKQVIEAIGFSLYFFEDDHRPGAYVAEKVQKAIQEADAVIVFITRNSENAPYVHQEVGYAAHANKPIIPLVESGVSSKALAMLQGREYISFDWSESSEKITPELCASLLGHLHKMDTDKNTREMLTVLLLVAACIGIAYLLSSE